MIHSHQLKPALKSLKYSIKYYFGLSYPTQILKSRIEHLLDREPIGMGEELTFSQMSYIGADIEARENLGGGDCKKS